MDGSSAPGVGREVHAVLGATDSMSVLVVGDHELVLHGVRVILAGQRWVARCLPATSTTAAVEIARRVRPEVALIDFQLADGSAELLCRRLRAASPRTRPVLLASEAKLSARTVAATGACAYVSKTWPARDLVRAVKLVGEGGQPPAVAAPDDRLSNRQREILTLLSSGRTNDEIARALHLSSSTVKQHTSALYRKLAVRNRAEAIGRAQALGLLGYTAA